MYNVYRLPWLFQIEINLEEILHERPNFGEFHLLFSHHEFFTWHNFYVQKLGGGGYPHKHMFDKKTFGQQNSHEKKQLVGGRTTHLKNITVVKMASSSP